MSNPLNPNDCPICGGDNGEHEPFAGKPCPNSVDPKAKAKQREKEIKELERLFRLTPSVRI